MAIDFGPDNDVVTKSQSLRLAAMALGILGIFCLLLWSMFADSKTAGCVTKARLAARDDVHVHDIRWTASAGCEFYASKIEPGLAKAARQKAVANKANARWTPEANVMRVGGEP